MTNYTAKHIEKFWARVDKSGGEDACWIWTAAHFRLGYGQVKINMKNRCAHRVAYELTYGTIPDGLDVLHACDCRACCNPSHLSLGTHNDNMQDMVKKKRHPHGETHARHKATLAQVREIRERISRGGVTRLQMQTEYGLSKGIVANIVTGKTWKIDLTD